MDDTTQPQKVVSSRRRKQNVRAQQRYSSLPPCARPVGTFHSYCQLGERQKRHIQALEARLVPANPLNEDATSMADSEEKSNNSSGRLFQQVPNNSTISFSTPPSSLSGPSPTTPKDDPLQTLRLIFNHVGDVDERTSARIRSGEITIRDILQAGLNSLNAHLADPSEHTHEKENGQPCSALRTDRILILKNRKLVHSHSLPSVYTNQLRLKQLSPVAAMRANAELFGLTFEELTDPTTQSLFYRDAIAEDGTKSVSSELLESTPHLQPIDIQIQRPHHAYVDLIPCPIFRQRFIQLTTMDPPMIDKHEFCADLENDGLICWGSYLGGKDEVIGSGAPWDIRSWEAQPWFLKKWWFVLGGKEGGFFQQSRWWHEVRGDQLPYFW